MLCDVLPKLGLLEAAVVLHKCLLINVLHFPIQFFDINPMGRILSRFSKDIDVLDMALPSLFEAVVYLVFEVIKFAKKDIYLI